MPNPDFTVRLIKDTRELQRFADILSALPAFALDIETTDWWNRLRERIALVQIAFRFEGRIKVAIIDPLADLTLKHLRQPLENASALKVIHNAAFDAARLAKHYDFKVSPVFDTMAAARRSGERKYSLSAQSAIHLQMPLDKAARTSDWSHRPLNPKQLHYAALDAYVALLLYENQSKRGLTGDYRPRLLTDSAQNLLPLKNESPAPPHPKDQTGFPAFEKASPESELPEIESAFLGIICELPSRYHPDGLAASIGSNRVGLAGWIIDRRLGTDAEPDEETVKLAISDLRERGLIGITESGRLAATESGELFWKKIK